MNKRIANMYYSGAFVATTVLCGLLSIKGLQNSQPVTFTSLLSGELAQRVEHTYDQNFAFKELGTNSWSAAELLVFNEGKPDVVVGNDGWLFTSEEFHAPLNADQAMTNNLCYIHQVKQLLADQQIELLVVPVPAKVRLYGQYAANQQPDALHQTLYGQFATALNNNDIAMLDSLSAMRDGDQQLFLRTDTHWTPEGAALIAQAVANQLPERFSLQLHSRTFATEQTNRQDHTGDLMNFLPLAPWFKYLLPETESLNRYHTYQLADDAADSLFADDLFSDDLFNNDMSSENTEEMTKESIGVALVGTSYSANPAWNFDGALKQHLATNVVNLAESGLGPMTPMNNFLHQQLAELPDLQLVIWEIPERYLLVNYPQVYADVPKHASAIASTTTTSALAANRQ